MRFAVNYSPLLAEMVRRDEVSLDLFKCPAWPEVIAEARQLRPAYAHLPLITLPDAAHSHNGERNGLMDWHRIDSILDASETLYVNIHFIALVEDFSDIPVDSTDPCHIERVVESAIKSVETLEARYGKDRVIVENNPSMGDRVLKLASLPDVISQVIEATDTGFLFDVSHAQLAALDLKMDPRDYIAMLPTDRIREMHVTGMDLLTSDWLDRFEAAGFHDTIFHPWAGKLMDHLPLRDEDWEFLDWALGNVHNGTWATPDIVALEYGGVGGVWEIMGEYDVYLSQIPRLAAMVHNAPVIDQSAE
jgi:hypothetical protein